MSQLLSEVILLHSCLHCMLMSKILLAVLFHYFGFWAAVLCLFRALGFAVGTGFQESVQGGVDLGKCWPLSRVKCHTLAGKALQ